MDFSSKNRSKELKRLASIMNIDNGEKLNELLRGQRSKMNNDAKKAGYIDWLLGNGDDAPTNKKRPRNSSTAEMLRDDTKVQDTPMGNDHLKNHDPSKKKRTVIRPRKPGMITTKLVEETDRNQKETDPSMDESMVLDPSLLSNVQFKDVAIHANTKKALAQVLKLQSMTEVQSKAFGPAMAGTDILARARTGTGKTLAFLIPALERLFVNQDYKPGKSVGVLVISPTRELASQIGDQAQKLITFHDGFSCQVMYGGTKMGRDVTALNKRLPSVLIATPGRLLDHMENTKLQNGKKFGYDVMRETKILVLDEADRLLDMGFRSEIKKILTFLPIKDKRQTLLFSATVPKELKAIIAENMKTNFQEVDCIRNTDDSSNPENHTNILVKQTFAILPSLDKQVTAVVQLIQEEMKSDPKHKIVVFFPTARMVQYFAEFFNVGLGIEVIELHSKKNQGYRNKASDKFRRAKTGILFTSDVSARGVDYPDVTRVIQFGLPESREQYIHRLGRTGRAGKEGQGILVLAPFEEKFLHELRDIEITENEKVTKLISDDSTYDAKLLESILKVLSRIRSGDARLTLCAEQCYQSYIGYYNGHLKRTTLKSKQKLVETANAFAKTMGLKEQPVLTKKAVSKMGLRDVKNIRIISEAELRTKKGI
jgi:ATP-dependent RNA helicase MSS116